MHQHILHMEEVESTNESLKKLVKDGAIKPPFCLYADHQSKGKGQRGNTWISEKGLNLMASFLISGKEVTPSIAAINAIGALAVIKSLEDLGLNQLKVKWPNDVFIGDLKLAGVLTENIYAGNKLQYTVVGIGLNVNQTEFPKDISATSLAAITGKNWSVDELLLKLYLEIYSTLNLNAEFLLSELNQRLYKKNRNVTFQKNGEYKEYEVKGISASGDLEVLDGGVSVLLPHHMYKWEK